MDYWAAALRLVGGSEAERAVVVAWAALGALEGMVRNHAMLRESGYAAHRAAWADAVAMAAATGAFVSR